MKLQQLLSLTRKAVDTYHLIDEGDHIAIGLSGGKDSLALLYALHGLQRFYPKKFSLTAVSVDLGMEGFDLTPVTKMCEELGISHHIIKTQIRQIVFEERKEKDLHQIHVLSVQKCGKVLYIMLSKNWGVTK